MQKPELLRRFWENSDAGEKNEKESVGVGSLPSLFKSVEILKKTV
jgi:hypothetical protein